jgi:hypothetical protein
MNNFSILFLFGGDDRIRTDDIQLAKLALSQLSYIPAFVMNNLYSLKLSINLVGLTGVEPVTFRLSGERSNRS